MEKLLSVIGIVVTEALRVGLIAISLWATEHFLQLLFNLGMLRSIMEALSAVFLISLWILLVGRDIIHEVGQAKREYEEVTSIFRVNPPVKADDDTRILPRQPSRNQ
jgi:hypothetical protein